MSPRSHESSPIVPRTYCTDCADRADRADCSLSSRSTSLSPSSYQGFNFANVTLIGYMILKAGYEQAVMLLFLLPVVEFYRYYASQVEPQASKK